MKNSKIILSTAAALSASVSFALPALMPMPQSVKENEGVFECKAESFAAIPVADVKSADVPAEGYVLTVDAGGIKVSSSSQAGAFYARKTLEQLATKGKGGKWSVPFVEISDAPAYPWRGVLLDDCRHFFGKEVVKRVLDQMADYKLNVFHWHLTEDQGWRIDVPGYPDLVKYGAVRSASPKHGARWNGRTVELNGEKYGPYYYTEADLREIVAYAAERHIKIVPEIELPGHVMALLAAYPDLACDPSEMASREPRITWGIARTVLCVGNDRALKVFSDILDYVCDVFPSDVIHIGGDECPRERWKTCPRCRARMEAEGLSSTDDLQAWITTKVAERLAKRGRRVLGWDEMLAGDVPKSAIGMSWRMGAGHGAGTAYVGPLQGAARGHDIVMTPSAFCYFDYGQGLKEDPFQYIGGNIPLRKAYAFDPAAGADDPAIRAHILGGQCNNWSEYTWNRFDLEWKMWPRTFATAEVLWTAPKVRDYDEFLSRVKVHRSRLVSRGVVCAPAVE